MYSKVQRQYKTRVALTGGKKEGNGYFVNNIHNPLYNPITEFIHYIYIYKLSSKT